MKSVKKYYISAVWLLLFNFIFYQAAAGQRNLSASEQKVLREFEEKTQEYTNLRERIEAQLPKLPKEATADQIENHKILFQKSVQAALRDAKQGHIFNPAAAQLIRKIIKNEFRGKDRSDLRLKVFEAETQGVPLKINFPYPDSKEQVEMPPTLLLVLPSLPKQLRYRFVGGNFLLVDRENGLIIDYMTDALFKEKKR